MCVAESLDPEDSRRSGPIQKESGIVALKGNLCVNGAIVKPNPVSEHLMKHAGKAVAFETIEAYKLRIDDPKLEVDESIILALKNVGPKGYPGMPEVGNMGLPKKVQERGIIDMVRISDGRMNGTGFGTVVLHVLPEAAVGGTLTLVKSGDLIELDIPPEIQRRPDLYRGAGRYRRYIFPPDPDHRRRLDLGEPFALLKKL